MDEQVKQHLITYLDKLEAAVQKGADIAAEQLPLALQEYIAYCRIASTWDLIACGLAGLVGLWFMFSAQRLNTKVKIDLAATAWCFIVGFLLMLGGGVFFLGNVKHCIKAWVAPRALLLEKVNELRKCCNTQLKRTGAK